MTDKLQEYFENAFDFKVIQVITGTGHSYTVPNSSVRSFEGGPYFEVTIKGIFIVGIPEGYNHLTWFDMRDCGHALHFIRHNTDTFGTVVFELLYRTDDLTKFAADVKDARYRRFSKHFHEQLEDILD